MPCTNVVVHKHAYWPVSYATNSNNGRGLWSDRELSPSSQRPPRSHRVYPSLHDGQFLGRGGTKNVTVETRKGGLVAVMRSQVKDLTMEATLMMKLSRCPHPHLLPLLSVESDASSGVRMVAPIAKYGSVLDLVDHLEFEGLAPSHEHMDVVLRQVEQAVDHLETQGLDHGDVRARNVLVFEFDAGNPCATHVRLADYGETRPGRVTADCIVDLAKELHSLVPR